MVRLEGRVVGGPVLYRLHEIESVDLLGGNEQGAQSQGNCKKEMFVMHDSCLNSATGKTRSRAIHLKNQGAKIR